MKAKKIGDVPSDLNSIVIFSLDDCLSIAGKMQLSGDDFLCEYGGIAIDLTDGDGNGDKGYEVNMLNAVQEDGKIVDMVLVGGDPNKIVRFLEKGEQSFDDFLRAHQDFCIVGEGEFFNQEVYDEIRAEWDNRPAQ